LGTQNDTPFFYLCAHKAAKIKLSTIGRKVENTGGEEKRSEAEEKPAIATANCCCTDTGNIIRIASNER